MHVSINILTWNDLRYLPDLFRSIEAQTYPDVSIRVLDNGSTDGTLEYIQKHHPQYLVARNVRNLGFAPGHNQLIKFALERWGEDLSDKAILLVNADMILHSTMVAELVSALLADPTLAATQPKLLRAFADITSEDGVEQNIQSDILDTTGLCLTKTWRMEDRGAGEVDTGQYDTRTDIIGATGTSALWRAEALKALSIDGEPLDGDFFAYREDCDLALRARRAGWKAAFVPSAKAHHYRGMYGAAKRGLWQRFLDRRKQRPFPAAMSTRNQVYFLIKNLTWGDLLRYGVWIIPTELSRSVYGLMFEPETRKLLLKSGKLTLKMFKKRSKSLAMAKESGKVIRNYVNS
ncbi:MAG: glycosyltransferase family 2 protein [Patescibacteria group bacterium]